MYKININEQLLILSQESYGESSDNVLHIEYAVENPAYGKGDTKYFDVCD